jgi:hypothetical protein
LKNTGVVAVDYINTTRNIADPFTKGLPRAVIDGASKEMGLRPLWVVLQWQPSLLDRRSREQGDGKNKLQEWLESTLYVPSSANRCVLSRLHGRMTVVLMGPKAEEISKVLPCRVPWKDTPIWTWPWGRGLWDVGNLRWVHEWTREHDRNAPIWGMALGGQVSAMHPWEPCLHKTGNSRLRPLHSCERAKHEVLGVAQPVTGLHSKAGIKRPAE